MSCNDDAYKKTEKILYAYPALKKAINNPHNPSCEKAREQVARIEEALQHFVNDPYYRVIPMRYFDNETLENIALEHEVSPTMIRKARRRLINQLKLFFFTDEVVDELFQIKTDTQTGIKRADTDVFRR